MPVPECPICMTVLTAMPEADGARSKYPCPNCGTFIIDAADAEECARLCAKRAEFRAIVSYAVRRLPTRPQFPTVTGEFIDRLFQEGTLPSLPEQMANLILWLGENTKTGHPLEIAAELHSARIGAADAVGFDWLVNH